MGECLTCGGGGGTNSERSPQERWAVERNGRSALAQMAFCGNQSGLLAWASPLGPSTSTPHLSGCCPGSQEAALLDCIQQTFPAPGSPVGAAGGSTSRSARGPEAGHFLSKPLAGSVLAWLCFSTHPTATASSRDPVSQPRSPRWSSSSSCSPGCLCCWPPSALLTCVNSPALNPLGWFPAGALTDAQSSGLTRPHRPLAWRVGMGWAATPLHPRRRVQGTTVTVVCGRVGRGLLCSLCGVSLHCQ